MRKGKHLLIVLLLLSMLVACREGEATPTPLPDQAIAGIEAIAEAQPIDITLNDGDSAEVFCRGRQRPIVTETERGQLLGCGTAVPATATPRATETATASATAPPTETAVPPTPTEEPTATAVSGPIDPFVDAPACPDIGIEHDDRAWHGIWNSEAGCHWNHSHGVNPHELDGLFGTEVYTIFGGELSYPWQTFAGANDSFEEYVPGTPTENSGKHPGNKVLALLGGQCVADNLYTNPITDARIWGHFINANVGAMTRFHSIYLQARGCNLETGETWTASGGGWVDFGRLNWPQRGVYHPLPNDDPSWATIDLPAEAAPYRIHFGPDQPNALESWQTEGNIFNCPNDDCSLRLNVGYGVHIPDAWGPADPFNPTSTPFYCYETDPAGCINNASRVALFRIWVILDDALDGTEWDEDSDPNTFTFQGYTNRYGDIVEGCESPGLDCVPWELVGVPYLKNGYRGDLNSDAVDHDICFDAAGAVVPCTNTIRDNISGWIEYPN